MTFYIGLLANGKEVFGRERIVFTPEGTNLEDIVFQTKKWNGWHRDYYGDVPVMITGYMIADHKTKGQILAKAKLAEEKRVYSLDEVHFKPGAVRIENDLWISPELVKKVFRRKD